MSPLPHTVAVGLIQPPQTRLVQQALPEVLAEDLLQLS